MNSFIQDFKNLDLLSVGIAISASIILGFAVLLSNPKSITNKIFIFFTFISSIWGAYNYFLYQFFDPVISLWFIRLVLFCAILQAFSFFLLTYVFPYEQKELPKSFKILAALVGLVAILTLTPLVFSGINPPDPGSRVAQAIPAPGILTFGLLAISLVIGGIVQLFRRRKLSRGNERRQLDLFLLGTGLMFTLIISFNFLAVVIFHNYYFIPYGALFTFPFILLIGFAILKYRLFNVKVIATEILSFLLVVFIFFEVVLSNSTFEVIIRSIVFLILLIVSVLLNRSVRKEVQQREQLQVLTKQLEAANEQLKILDQARSEFITIASHQLRTPPATIKWYLASILDGDYGKFDDTVKEQLRKTMSANNSMISLIDDLLNVSRIERGKMEFIFQPTDLTEITHITVDQLLPQSEMKKLELMFTKPQSALPIITADKEKLRQVINNLVDNAIKYTQQGKVEVSLSQTKKDLIFKVTDTGRGVAPDQLKHVFEKFDRGKSPVKNSIGLGLGLYVAKVIIEQHKGKIWVESKGEGKGSSFIFTVPIKTQLENTVFDLTKTQKG